jgi:hypothetical protein
MNTWGEIKKTVIFEADDFCDRYDRNGLNYIFYWKTKYPNFKITLFTIPDRTSDYLLTKLHSEELMHFAMHGWNHESNFENYGWDYDKTMAYLDRMEKRPWYDKIYKAPGWTIYPGLNGYPADENALINKDKQAVYKALKDRDYIIFDRHYNKEARPEGTKIVCVDCNPDIVHAHTWNMETGDKNGRNGFGQIEEEHGVPWDNNSEFHFITEAWEKGLFLPCQN